MGKMSVRGALAVYSIRVIAALRSKAIDAATVTTRRELLALAKHLEMGRSRFDVSRSSTLKFLREKPLRYALNTYNADVIQLMREHEQYYEKQIENGLQNQSSTVWSELVSASVAMRCFIKCETSQAPESGYVMLSRLSTDPLESLFSFL
eukprot:IDg21436t1